MMITRRELEPTYWVRIYISGPKDIIEQACREFCFAAGLCCVTVTETKYIFTGGEETGVIIELINYPRFPKPWEKIRDQAQHLAKMLCDRCRQHSVLIMDSDETMWLSQREDGPIENGK